MATTTKLPDLAARLAALTELERSFLVEAGAGSGKTAIMAGRVVMLLARGVEPKRVAAITFTEFAASELLIRITDFVNALANGKIPRDLEIVFPKGVSAAQKANLEQAKKSLDQLFCSTIHGFAQALIKPYPAEARIDPGAEIIDPSEADIAFEELYDSWLRDHLSGRVDDDVVAELVVANQNGAVELIRNIADFRRKNRDARAASIVWSPDLLGVFTQAVAKFSRVASGWEFDEPETASVANDFVDFAKSLASSLVSSGQPTSRALIDALFLARPETCFTQVGGKRVLQKKGQVGEGRGCRRHAKIEGRRGL